MQIVTAWPGRRFKPGGMGALVFGLVLACYWPALQGGLVWDDAAHVTRPELLSWSGLGRLEEAKKHWETALQLNPSYEDARRNLELLRKRQRP